MQYSVQSSLLYTHFSKCNIFFYFILFIFYSFKNLHAVQVDVCYNISQEKLLCCGENRCDMRRLIFLCPSVCRSLRGCLFCRWSYEERLVFLMWRTAAQPRTSKTKERLMHPIIHLHCWSQIWVRVRAIAKTLSMQKYQTSAQIALLKHKTAYDFFHIFLPCDKCQLTEGDLSLSFVLCPEILLFKMLLEMCIVKCVIKIETCIFFRQHFQ